MSGRIERIEKPQCVTTRAFDLYGRTHNRSEGYVVKTAPVIINIAAAPAESAKQARLRFIADEMRAIQDCARRGDIDPAKLRRFALDWIRVLRAKNA